MSYKAGEFCWVDLRATDAADAKRFYGEVFGWVATDSSQEGHPYSMFRHGSDTVAGLGEMSAEMKAGGVPVVWNSYVAVEDIEEAVARATELGASVMFPPQKGGESGWLAFLTDPEGAVFALWQALPAGTPAVRGKPNTCSWNELNTREADKATAFYGALFGWSFESVDVGAGRRYTTIKRGDQSVGGVLEMDESMGEAPAHWAVYFASDDVDATVARAKAAGGRVCVEPMDLPAGRFAMLFDPQGGSFAVAKFNH